MYLSGNKTGATDVKMDGSVLEEKWYFKTFSSKLGWGYYIISIAETTSQENWNLDSFYEVSSPEIALYLYKSTIQPCMEYC